MASTIRLKRLVFLALQLLSLISLFHSSNAARKLASLVQDQPLLFQYHHGQLLSGPISLNLIWYGKFKPSQRAIVTDFLTSVTLPPSKSQNHPSVAMWWWTTEKYYSQSNTKTLSLSLGKQILGEICSLGKSLRSSQIMRLAVKGPQKNAININLTVSDMAVEGFCLSRCRTHGSSPRGMQARRRKDFENQLVKNRPRAFLFILWYGPYNLYLHTPNPAIFMIF